MAVLRRADRRSMRGWVTAVVQAAIRTDCHCTSASPALAHQTSLRLLEPPMPLLPINQLMLWNAHAEADLAHQWLRQQLTAMAAELNGPQPELEPTRPGTGQDHERGSNVANTSDNQSESTPPQAGFVISPRPCCLANCTA
jgi:hypothetical protein